MSGRTDESRRKFFAGTTQFIEDAKAGRNNNHVLPVIQYPGAGKTYGIRERLETLGPIYFYLSPRHNIIENDFVAKGTIVPHLLSRSRFIDEEKKIPFCMRARKDPGILSLLQHEVIYVGEGLCEDCEFKDTCDYWKSRYLIESDFVSWMGVHAHINSFLPGHLSGKKDKYDLAVIDENPYFSLFAKHDLIDLGEVRGLYEIVTANSINNSDAILSSVEALSSLYRGGDPRKFWDKAIEKKQDEDLE